MCACCEQRRKAIPGVALASSCPGGDNENRFIRGVSAAGSVRRQCPGRPDCGGGHRRYRRRPAWRYRRRRGTRTGRRHTGGRDRRRWALRGRGAAAGRVHAHVHAAGLRGIGAYHRAGRGVSADRRRQPASRRPVRGSDRLGDRHRHRRARHQHAPCSRGGQPRDDRAAGVDAARRSLQESQRKPRRNRRAEQLVQLQPALDAHRERGQRQPARPRRLADARADQRPPARAGPRASHRRAFRRREHHPGHRDRSARGAEGGGGRDLRLRRRRRRRQLRHAQ